MLALTSILLATASVAMNANVSPIQNATEQRAKPARNLTTSAGAPVFYSDASVSLNTKLLHNEYLMESLSHFAQERIPERVVHAKGAGAFGYFKVTHDISNYCAAELFNAVGKKTPVAVRFSSVVSEKGGNDLSRDARGFAVKFYTQEGNFDIVGQNTPMFIIKDPLRFPNFMRALKKNPSSNLNDVNTIWDILTLNPDSMYTFLLIFGDHGIPASYGNMPGYSIQTYQVYNNQSKLSFFRFHFIPDAGVKYLTIEKADRITAEDFDYYTRKLYGDIEQGKFPCWTVGVQVLSLDDVKKASYDVFDLTRTISLDKFPLKIFGKLILNRNPKNYFAEVEQLAFCPGNLVPGISGDPSSIFEARRFAYREAHNYRLGTNFNKISVNYPCRTKPFTYNRDGRPPVQDNEKDNPNYYPNSFNGPMPYIVQKPPLINIIEKPEPNNFEQAADLYINMTKDARDRLIFNIVSSLKLAAITIQKRAVALFNRIHPDLGQRVAEGLRNNQTIG